MNEDLVEVEFLGEKIRLPKHLAQHFGEPKRTRRNHTVFWGAMIVASALLTVLVLYVLIVISMGPAL